MGKHKRLKFNTRGAVKKGNPPVINEDVRKGEIVPLVQRLKSVSSDERSSALTTVVKIIEDENMRHMLLRERLIKALLTNILSDSSLENVALGLRILRRIVSTEGRDPALFLVRENIRLPLNNIASKVKSSLDTDLNLLDAAKIQILNELSDNICGLAAAILFTLGQLKDVDNVIVLASSIVHLALKNVKYFTPQVIESSFELLYYLSEDSPEKLIELEGVENIKNLSKDAFNIETKTWPTLVYALGIECNSLVLEGEPSSDAVMVSKKLMSLLRDSPRNEVVSIQVLLELLALLAQTCDLGIISSIAQDAGQIILDEFVKDANYAHRSINVLNNIGWSLNSENHDWKHEAQNILGAIMVHCSNWLDDPQLLSSALGLISATIVQDPDLVNNPSLKELVQKLLDLVEKLHREGDVDWIDLARALIILFQSEEGQLAANLNIVTTTSQLIFSILEFSDDAEAQIDALDLLFDLFADNESSFNDEEYVKKDLNKKLEQLRPNLRRSLKSIPRADDVLRERAVDALTNLDNFIVYKRG